MPIIKRRSRGSSDSYKQVLIEGEIDVAYSRIMLLGVAGVGKTSLRRGLMRCPWSKAGATSTLVAELHSVRPVNYQWMGRGDLEQWEEVTHQDEINELARLLAMVYEKSQSKDAEKMFGAVFNVAPSANANSKCTSSQGSPSPAFPDCFDEETALFAVDSTLQEAIERIDSVDMSNEVKVQPFLHVWDCGGQPVFLEMLPAFLTSHTMFLLLFDASKDFDSMWESVQYQDGKQISGEKVKMTIIDVIVQWMANIFAHLVQYDAQGALLEYPRILIVGTRGDLLSDEEKAEKKKAFLSHCEGKAYMELLQDFLIVDNTLAKKPGEDGEEPNFEVLRKYISDFTTMKLIEKTHVSWVLFRKVIQGVEQNVITLDDAYAIGAACKIPMDKVMDVLKFYHELGVLLFYPNIEGLETKIIIKPKWFVDILGKVLTLEGREEYKTMHQWNIFRQFGVLIQPLYVAAWKDCEGVKPEAIMALLTSFCLAAPVQTKLYHKHDVKQYFLPAVLPACTENLHALPPGFIKRAAPLQILFAVRFVPPGFFTRLVAKVTDSAAAPHSNCKMLFDEASESDAKKVYRNRFRFRYGNPPYDDVILTDLIHVIQVDVLRFVPDEAIDALGKVCHNLLAFLDECCTAVSKVLHSNIQIETRFVCCDDKCKQMKLHHIVHTPGQTQQVQVYCEASDKYRPLTAEEKYWFSVGSITQDGVIPDKEIYKLSKEIDQSKGMELAIVLNLRLKFKEISSNSSEATQPILNLLLAWKDISGQRSDLANALHEIGQHRVADMVYPSDDHKSTVTAPATHSTNNSTASPTSAASETVVHGLIVAEPSSEEVNTHAQEHELAMSDKEILDLSKKINSSKIVLLAANLNMLSDLEQIKNDEIEKTAPVLSLLYRWRKLKHDKKNLANALKEVDLPDIADLVYFEETEEYHDLVNVAHSINSASASAAAKPVLSHSMLDEVISDREILKLSKCTDITPSKLKALAAHLNLLDELKLIESKQDDQTFQFLCKWKEVSSGRRDELYDALKEAGLPDVAERCLEAVHVNEAVDFSLPPTYNDLSVCLTNIDDNELECLAHALRVADTDPSADRTAKIEKCLEILQSSAQFQSRQDIFDYFKDCHLFKAANILAHPPDEHSKNVGSTCKFL